MRQFIISTVVLLLALTSSTGYADGLIHRLPEDGASVTYKMEMTMALGGGAMASTGTLTVSSVGQTTVDDETCRWIEFKMKMKMGKRERTIIGKVLIPEIHLISGKTPIDHVKKCWLKQGDDDVLEVKDVKGEMGGPMPVFLSGPLKDAKKLKPEVIENKLGKLTCKGLAGRLEFKQGTGDGTADIETRLHASAPFGVVTSNIHLKMSHDGQPGENISWTLKLAEVGKNAKSELPDAN
jgi:hypothetical protein